MRSAPLPRLADVVFISILGASMLLGQRMVNVDADLGRHLTLGRFIVASHGIPTTDILSFTKAGLSRPPYEWLSQLAFALADAAGGLGGVILVTGIAIAAAFSVAFLDARRRGAGLLLTTCITLWAAAAASIHWLTRPHVFSFLFLSAWIYFLEDLRRGERKALWQLPVLMLFWANLHGGFVFGFVAWVAYGLGWLIQDRREPAHSRTGRRLLVVGALSSVASCVTPALGANWSAVLRNSSAYILSRTAETMPISLTNPSTWPFLVLCVAGVLLGVQGHRRIAVAHGLLAGLYAILAVAFMRNIPLFCITAIPVLAECAGTSEGMGTAYLRLERRTASIDASIRGFWWSASALLIACLAIGLHSAWTGRDLYRFDPRRFPVNALNWLESEQRTGNMLNDINWGGYVLYRLWPGTRVFVDSQTDFYGEAFVRQYVDLISASDSWRQQLDHHGISLVVLPPDAPLSILLMNEPGWSVPYRDSTAIVMTRDWP